MTSFVNAQLVIIGQNGETPDELMMVALEAIPSGEIFHVTDNEYSSSNDEFTVGEGSVTFLVTNPVSKGDVFSVKNDGGWSIEGTTNMIVLSFSGNLNISFGDEQSYVYKTSNDLFDGSITEVVTAFDNWDGSMPAEIDPSINYPNSIVLDFPLNIRNATFDGSRELSDLSEILDFTNWMQSDTRIDLDLTDFAGSALPIELSRFNGRNSSEGNILFWETASEIENDRFSIERSTDGSNFYSIDYLLGAGTTFSTSQYEYVDAEPSNGLNYYRLKQIDFNGQYTYSNAIVIENRKQLEFDVYPTVVADHINIESSSNEEVEIILFDGAGRQVLRNSTSSTHNIIELSSLMAGTYYVAIYSNNEVFTEMIIKL